MDKILILLLGGVALTIVYKRREQFLDSDDPTFREGFAAGWFTPGPIMILAFMGYGLAYI